MTYQDLGYYDKLGQNKIAQNLENFQLGRIILEHKERYIVKTPENEFDAELIGKLRFAAESRYDFPAVGDWVAFSEYDKGKALIHEIYPRHSTIERKAVGKSGQVQIIATNIDYGLIVQSATRDFNLNRLERYLTICYTSNVAPIIVISKTDLVNKSELEFIINQINQRIQNVPIITTSHQTKGYDQLKNHIQIGKTYCLLGSSGVGKSTLLNNLSGKQQMKTNQISSSVNKGKHTTSHRELIVLEGGGILIDNPGMREVGITDAMSGLEITFDIILEYAENCRFKDCTHTHEKGCAVLEAVQNGEINEDLYANFQKMERERTYFEADAQEIRRKDKAFGKMIKNVKKHRKRYKY